VTLAVRRYADTDRDACLGLFDANCPRFFAPGERADFVDYLESRAAEYRVCERDGAIVAAFGVALGDGRARLNWIMVDPAAQGSGAGREMIGATLAEARAADARAVDIAASHLSAPFFARFGARELARTEDGWGPGMHRVDMALEL
jgi:GNAT superfamily N-acetyltransferase